LVPAIPILPKRFELPGAALFATPGMPAVKSNLQSPEPPAVSESLPEPPAAAAEHRVNPVGPTIPAPATTTVIDPEPPFLRDSERPAQPRTKSRIAWIAIFSIVGCAFIGGIALRRCTAQSNRDASPARVDVVQTLAEQDAANMTRPNTAGSTAIFDASVSNAAVAGADTALIADAGAPSASASPKPAPARTYVRRAPARSSSKVIKGKGKTTRAR